MASIQTTSILARARPTRVPPTRSIVTPSSVPSGANSNHASPPNGASSTGVGSPTAALAAAALGSSNISLFLTNLRLLDLDLEPDWPGINHLTFTNKDIAQGQKKRIQSVEWALFQLFYLWDEEETKTKLQPFFPPLDNIQSLNLRAALLRCLESAKRNGALGRDAVVRKTMLDECKGERLEEVLAAFSSAVLKKIAAEAHLNDPAVVGPPALAHTLALENRGYSGDSGQMATLVLAHRVSLSRHLRKKDEARLRYRDLSQLLDLKEKGIARRTAQLKAHEAASKSSSAERPMTEDEKLVLWRAIRNNWSGNERWMETLLYGDAPKDGLLTAPFDRVWRRTRTGRLSELEENRDGNAAGGRLLAQLDGRVRAQKDRLKKWQDFRRNMFGTNTARQDREQKRKSLGPGGLDAASAAVRQKGIDLGFGAHESLRLGGLSPRKLPVKTQALKPEYATLVDDLRWELDVINKGAPNPFVQGLPRAPVSSVEDSIPDNSDLEQENLEPEPKSKQSTRHEVSLQESADAPVQRNRFIAQPIRPTASTRDTRQGDSDGPRARPRSLILDHNTRLPSTTASGNRSARQGSISSPTHRRNQPSSANDSTQEPPRQQAPSLPRTPSPPRSPRRQRASRPVHSRKGSEAEAEGGAWQQQQPAVSQTQQLADEILNSMDNASHSPEKKSRPRHTLSLAERTRLSMVRGPQSGGLDDVNEDDESHRLRLKRADAKAREESAIKETAEEDEADDLVARTRRSMANFEATRQKVQLERRQSQRKAARESAVGHQHRRNAGGGSVAGMPATAEVEENGGGEGESMLVDEIMQQGLDDDYAAVFMSRPKIKTSPPASPMRHWED